ncbi:MAG: hypothetical protein ACXVDD_21140, partial [Polyangia bacterium]
MEAGGRELAIDRRAQPPERVRRLFVPAQAIEHLAAGDAAEVPLGRAAVAKRSVTGSAAAADASATRRARFTVADGRTGSSRCDSGVPVRRERQVAGDVILPRAPLRIDGRRHPVAQHAQMARRRRDQPHAGSAHGVYARALDAAAVAIEADLALGPDDLVGVGELELELHDVALAPSDQRPL